LFQKGFRVLGNELALSIAQSGFVLHAWKRRWQKKRLELKASKKFNTY
jgi:hypothetical protein